MRIDGHDVCEQDRTVLGPRIGFVPAVGDLLDGSIRENIARFAPAPLERIREAAEQAAVNAAIEALPEGYDTRVGRSGRRPDVADRPGPCSIRYTELYRDRGTRGRPRRGPAPCRRARHGPAPVRGIGARPVQRGTGAGGRNRCSATGSGRLCFLPRGRAAVVAARGRASAAGHRCGGRNIRENPRIHTLEQVLARIRDNVTTQPEVRLPTTVPADTSRPPREASLTAEPAGAGPVLHINPEWLARQVGRAAR